jgi:hypothetical protein
VTARLVVAALVAAAAFTTPAQAACPLCDHIVEEVREFELDHNDVCCLHEDGLPAHHGQLPQPPEKVCVPLGDEVHHLVYGD